MLKNEMESYVRLGGKAFEKSYVPLHGGRGGVKNCQNHPCVINEWPLRAFYSLAGELNFALMVS